MAKGPTVSTTFNAKDKISSPMKKMQKNMKTFALAGGAAIAAASVVAVKAVNNFANAGDEIAKSARKVGVSVEALQELRFAADRSGISADTLQTSLQKLNKNVGDLRAGTGALKTILDKTNPALAEQLKNAESNEEAFAIMTKAMAETENQMDKAALAQAAFGRAGQDLLIMTENGAEGIEQLREEARKYGNVISTEAAAASEMYVDSLTNMKASMTALRNKALIPLMNKLQPMIQMVADYVAANQDLINQKIEMVFQGISRAVSVFVKLWDSGVIPGILAGVTAFIGITKAIAAYEAILAVVKVAQVGFNIAMSANPIGVLIVSITALLLLMKELEERFGLVKKVVDEYGGGVGSREFEEGRRARLAERQASAAASDPRRARLMSRNEAALSGTTNSSELSVNFNNAPAGTSFQQKGSAPGITVDTGRRGRL